MLFNFIFEVAVLERILLEKSVGAGCRVSAIDADRRSRHFARNPQLIPPFKGLLRTKSAGLREDCIDLRHRESLDRVVLVDVDGQRVDGDRKCGRFIAEFSFEGIDLGIFHRAGHWTQLRSPFDQSRWCGAGSLPFDLNFDAWILLAKSFGPQRHEVVERVRPNAVDIACHPSDFHIALQGRVQYDGVIGMDQWNRRNKSPKEDDAG